MDIQNKELHRIVTTVIIYKRDGDSYKYLITKRSPNKKVYPNMWTVPGGGLHTDDYINTPKTTSDGWYFCLDNSTRREIKEEVSLEIGHSKFLLDMTFIRPDGIPVIVLSLYAPYISGEVKLDDGENVDFKWVLANEAKNYEMIEGIAQEIEMVDRILKGENADDVIYKSGLLQGGK